MPKTMTAIATSVTADCALAYWEDCSASDSNMMPISATSAAANRSAASSVFGSKSHDVSKPTSAERSMRPVLSIRLRCVFLRPRDSTPAMEARMRAWIADVNDDSACERSTSSWLAGDR